MSMKIEKNDWSQAVEICYKYLEIWKTNSIRFTVVNLINNLLKNLFSDQVNRYAWPNKYHYSDICAVKHTNGQREFEITAFVIDDFSSGVEFLLAMDAIGPNKRIGLIAEQDSDHTNVNIEVLDRIFSIKLLLLRWKERC